MTFDVMVMMMVGLAISFMSGAGSAPCPSSTVTVNVTSTADVQNLTEVLTCTGEGAFNITWYTSLTVPQTIEVSNKKNVTVTGAGYPSIRGALVDDNGSRAVVDAGSGSSTFSVSNRSSLRLNNLVLAGGNAEQGGAVDLHLYSSLFISGCTFAYNNASNGGGIYASTSAIYVAGNTSFAGNSAQFGGAIHLCENSTIHIDGSTINGNPSFVNNKAGKSGGALYASSSSAVDIDGNIGFDNNSAVITGGALYASMRSSIDVDGNSVFGNNSAGFDGGAISLDTSSSINIDGSSYFHNNLAGDDGGAMGANKYSSININGQASFVNNTARGGGGALSAIGSSSIDMDGNSSFANNFATLEGGALYASTSSSIDIDGNSIFVNNSCGYDGGAISLYSSCLVKLNGTMSFLNNTSHDDGGAIGAYYNVSININGNASFVANVAMESGGALYASESCSVEVDGNSRFGNNLAMIDGGAIFLNGRSSMNFDGSTSIVNNLAEANGGAIGARESASIHFDGDSYVFNNSADDGGAAYIIWNSLLTIDGNTSLHTNSARNSGGAIYASESRIHIDGHTYVTHNTARSPGGGVLFASQTEVNIDGSTYVTHNSGYDGGAILAQESEILITGNATFSNNSAKRDGGAIKTTDTSLIIGTSRQGAEVSLSSGPTGGVMTTTQKMESIFIETIVFSQNTAFDYGGAISLANPLNLNISYVTFVLNEAESGGAVALTSTVWAPAEFQRCRFEYNQAIRGGALYLTGEGRRFIEGSSLRYNVAEEIGGAILNAGALEIRHSSFTENTARDGGLAIQNIESPVVLWNVTFDGNILSCPSQTYSYTQYTSPDSCRFELACTQCLEGCQSDLSNVTIDTQTLPTCEPIPLGVWPSSTAITLQTFNIKEGYYRVSAESPIVLDCFQTDACVGGTNPRNYCAIGYEGPYCAVCTKGYAPSSSNRCQKCSRHNLGIAVGFSTTVMVLVLFVALLVVSDLLQIVIDEPEDAENEQPSVWQGNMSRLRTFLAKAIPLSSIRIVVVVLQIVVQFTEIAGTVYPDEYEAFLSRMALVNFDIGSLVSSSCLLTTNFYDRLVIATVAPLLILLACVGMFFIALMRNGNSSSAGTIVKHKHLSLGLFVVFFVYSSVSFTIFQTFVCDPLDDGNAYLRADYSITCYTQTHTAYQIYASLMVCIYPVGIPAFFASWLVHHRRVLDTPGRETIPRLKPYRSLWAVYKPSCYYYEVVECGRRIALTGAAVFVLPGRAEQVAIVLFVAVVFMFVSESISPFESKVDMWLHRWGNGIILASMYVALLLKVDLAVEDSRSSSAMTAVLIAANVFMVFTVAVQAILLMRGLCVWTEREQTAQLEFPLRRRPEQASSGRQLETTRSNT